MQYVQECLSGPDSEAPIVIGGVVQVRNAQWVIHHV